jgi:uncharacterized protein YbjQ (UPF0145 family)
MILVSTASEIDGYRVLSVKGTTQGANFEDLLRHAETLGANAILKADYKSLAAGYAIYHGTAVLVEPTQKLARPFR